MNTRLVPGKQQQAVAPPPARKTARPAPTTQAGVPYFLQAKTPVQRDESKNSLPPLTMPQTFGAKKAEAGLLADTPQLKLDPQIQLYLIEMLFSNRLDPASLRAALRGALQAPAGQKAAPTAIPNLRLPITPPVASAAPTVPTPTVQTPTANPGITPTPAPFPEPPRPGEVGDVIEAATSAAAPVLEPMKAQLFSQLKQGWGSFSTVERVGVVSFGVGTVSLAGIGVFGNPDARSFLFDKLNGVVIPVPGAGWLGLETHIDGGYLFFGAHLDVGRLLPEAMGFGPADFNSITDPKPEYVPQRRADETGLLRVPEDASARIAAAQSGGSPLPLAVRGQIESGLGADLSQVRVHDDIQADVLARDLAANAFTSGAHIFMRAGQYHPDSPAGLRLLSHEAAHTLQQAHGPVNGVPVGGGIELSQPGDAFESAADQAADRVMSGTRGVAATDLSPASPNALGTTIQRQESQAHTETVLLQGDPAEADSAVDDIIVWFYINTALANNDGSVWDASCDLSDARRAPGWELDPNLAAAEHYMFARVIAKGAPSWIVAAAAIEYGLGKELLKDFGIDPSFTDKPTTESSTKQISYGMWGAFEESWIAKLLF